MLPLAIGLSQSITLTKTAEIFNKIYSTHASNNMLVPLQGIKKDTNKKGKVRINVILRRVRVTIFAMEMQ